MTNKSARYTKTTLTQSEKIVKIFQEHWILRLSYWLSYLLGIAGLAVGWFAIVLDNQILNYAIMGAGGLLILMAISANLKFNFREAVLTNDRMIFKRGIIAVKTEEQRLRNTSTIEIDQTILGRILGYATIKLTETGGSELIIPHIAKPRPVKISIEEQLRQKFHGPTQNQTE